MELSLVHVSENQKAISWLSALAGATIPIADLGDLEGGEPGARYAGSAGILPALGRPRRIKKARRVPEATALYREQPPGRRRSQGEAAPNGCYPTLPSRPHKDSIMISAYLY